MGTQFQKNIGIMGGLLYIAVYGAGRFSQQQQATTNPGSSDAGSVE